MSGDNHNQAGETRRLHHKSCLLYDVNPARIGPDLDKPGDAAEWANYHAWRQAVEALAQPYAGEPGWRDEWGTQ